jgi:hypothetical protein
MPIQVTVGWNNPNPNTNLDHIEIWRKTGVGGTYAQIGSDIMTTTAGVALEFNDTNAGAGLEIGVNYFYEVRAYNSAGVYSVIEDDITIVSADYVVLNTSNTTVQGTMAYTAGSPGYFQATSAFDQGRVNNQYNGPFDIKVFLRDGTSNTITLILDDSNVLASSDWGLIRISVMANLNLTIAGNINTLTSPDVPTTVAVSTVSGNYLRMSRIGSAASGVIFVHYFNGTTETLVHTFAPQATGTWVKFMTGANRRLYNLQIK